MKICSKCRKPIIFEGKIQKSACACDAPSNPWDCDDESYPLLRTLWDKGYETEFSCSGHPYTIFYGGSDYTTPYIKTSVDGNPYIAIKASSVKVKDLDKWKYGEAYIRYEDSIEMMKKDIELFIDLPKDWIYDPNDPIIQPYMDMVGEEQANRMRNDVLSAHFCIRTNYHENDDASYIQKYMTLVSDRYDMSKLIDLLPINK